MNSGMTFELGVRDRKRLAARLAAGTNARPLAIRTSDGEIDLPAPARRAVEQVLAELAAGNAVHVVGDEHDMTTQEVADLLRLSRTFVVRLIDEGKLAAHFAGSHRRIRAADAFAYQRHRQSRLAGVEAITAADIAAGVPYH
jgi:excisionase family DNA binding protein